MCGVSVREYRSLILAGSRLGLGDLEGIAQDLRRDRRADAVVGGPRQMRNQPAGGGAGNDAST